MKRSTRTPLCTGITVQSAHCASPQKVNAHFNQTNINHVLHQESDFHFVSDCELVLCVWFFCAGTNLLSGGIESVLVQWKYQENQRDFLPRLGGAITHIAVSPDGALFCTSHSDNSKLLPAGALKPISTSHYSLFTGFSLVKNSIASEFITFLDSYDRKRDWR